MGLPVLTQRGASFASRVAASLLNAIELPGLITGTPAEYEETAIAIARDPLRLRSIRRQLAHNRQNTPLFDAVRFTKAIECAYSAMYERHHAGLPPDHMDVEIT
jgi:predicted O-linked N-acetylglucosamine transferase (SPINDLY family)